MPNVKAWARAGKDDKDAGKKKPAKKGPGNLERSVPPPAPAKQGRAPAGK